MALWSGGDPEPEWTSVLLAAPGHLLVQVGRRDQDPPAPDWLGPLVERTRAPGLQAWQLAP